MAAVADGKHLPAMGTRTSDRSYRGGGEASQKGEPAGMGQRGTHTERVGARPHRGNRSDLRNGISHSVYLRGRAGQYLDAAAAAGTSGTLDLVVRDRGGREQRHPIAHYAVERVGSVPFNPPYPNAVPLE